MSLPEKPKLVVIGAGSVIFGLDLLSDLFQTPELRGCRLTLVDVDAAKLERMVGLAARLNEASNWGISLDASTDRTAVLDGADFVVTAVDVRRDDLWKLDHELCLKHGFPSVLSENAGPGGLSHTLRAIPLVVDICRDVEHLCPAALLINYTNPEGRVCLAIRRHTGVRAVGLCHGVAETVLGAAVLLERPVEEIELLASGVNHFTWVTSLRDRRSGEDLYPEFRRRLGQQPPEVQPLSRLLFERFGLFPTTGDDHVGEFIGWAAEVIGTKGYDFDTIAAWRTHLSRQLDAWNTGAEALDSLLKEPSRERALGISAAGLVADLVAGRSAPKHSLILPNDGYIDNVDAGAVVEVPGVIEKGKMGGLRVGSLPGPIASMVAREVEIQELVVDAAVSGSRELALQALLIDPVVHSARAAEAFLDEVLSVHGPYLPTFQ
jgi:alpha-galactosidase/6-phospho-beta-glucosidase family protein